MEASLINHSDNAASILIVGYNIPLMNALRRSILNNVHTLAIEDVTMYKNSSTMYDEVLASRLGLLPLRSIQYGGKGKKEFKFKLEQVGPKTVYAYDLVPEDPDIKPVYGDTILLTLKEGEKIELEAKATFGTGAEHAKFAPAHVFYHAYPSIETTKSEIKGASKIASLCPVNILDGENNKLSVKKGHLQECILCMACQDYAGEDVIKISADKNKLVFEIESWGQLTVKDIFEEAFDNLEEEIKETSKVV